MLFANYADDSETALFCFESAGLIVQAWNADAPPGGHMMMRAQAGR